MLAAVARLMNIRIAMVLCAADSEIAPTSRLARNTKYLYQDSTVQHQTEDYLTPARQGHTTFRRSEIPIARATT